MNNNVKLIYTNSKSKLNSKICFIVSKKFLQGWKIEVKITKKKNLYFVIFKHFTVLF